MNVHRRAAAGMADIAPGMISREHPMSTRSVTGGGTVDLKPGKDIRRAMPLITSREVLNPRQLADEDIDLRSLAHAQVTGD
jgi:hypothetical protein